MKHKVSVSSRNVTQNFIARRDFRRTLGKGFVGIISDQPEPMILLQHNVFKLLPIGLGWTLLSTSPIMALFFARAEGEEVNWKTYVLTATTILGVGIVFI